MTGGMKMIARLLVGSVLVGIAALIAASLPDIARYLKMRDM